MTAPSEATADGVGVAIDGRDIAKARAAAEAGGTPDTRQADAYESRGIRVVSHAIVWVPVALVVWFAYVSGTWIGGAWGGVLSVVSVVLTAVGVWVWRRLSRKRR